MATGDVWAIRARVTVRDTPHTSPGILWLAAPSSFIHSFIHFTPTY